MFLNKTGSAKQSSSTATFACPLDNPFHNQSSHRTYFFRALEFPSDDVRPDRKSGWKRLEAVGNLGFTQRGPNLISTRKVEDMATPSTDL